MHLHSLTTVSLKLSNQHFCSYENVSLLFCISDFVKISLVFCILHFVHVYPFFHSRNIFSICIHTKTINIPVFLYPPLCTYFFLLFCIMYTLLLCVHIYPYFSVSSSYFVTLCTCLSLLFLYSSLWTYLSLHFVHIYPYFSVSFTYVSLLLCILYKRRNRRKKAGVSCPFQHP